MISRKRPALNRRRPGSRSGQNLLEVKIRSRLANQQRNRRILVWTCKALLLFMTLGGASYGVREGLRHFFWENPEYDLAVVEIHNDGKAVTREMVLSATGLQVGENIFGVSLAKARAALAELPQVEQAQLRRILPNKIAIEIVERRPVAWLADIKAPDPMAAESSFLVDAKGTLFQPKRTLPEYLRLPVIYGVPPQNFLSGERVDAPEVLAALDLIRINGNTGRVLIQSIDLSKGYCMVVTDTKQAKISFPLEDIDRHLDRLTAVLEGVAPQQMEIQTVNLLVERNIPVTFVRPPEEEAPPAAQPAAAAPARPSSARKTEPAKTKSRANSRTSRSR